MTDHTDPSLRLRVTAALPIPADPDMWPDGDTVPVVDQARDLYLDGDGDLSGDGFEALLMAAELGDGTWTASVETSRAQADEAATAAVSAVLGNAGFLASSTTIEAIIAAVLDTLPVMDRFEVNDDNVPVWACMADTPQVADREECEVQGCRGDHYLLAATRKVPSDG